jgi:4-amino-4-deoxy-L-arabinose transferase-like glycosyltransferase
VHRLLAVWVLLAALALAIHLGGYPLFEPDEGRNGEVGREMAETNDYVLPHFDGLPYLDKPIVYFAAEAAVMEVLGPTELAARLPAFLFTIFTAALVWRFARRNGIDEHIATIAFLAMPLTMAFARTVIFDSALAFFVTAAIVAFYEERPTIAWAAIAFGVLTKGPVAIALPLLVCIPYAIWHKRFRTLWSWGGLALFVVIIAPWVWGVERAIPDFLHYVLVTETAQRLATKALKRTGPPWYFVPYIIGGAFPWSIAAFFGERRAASGERRRDRFLLLWILVPFIFFSISQSKRPQYILPLMPAIALFVASRWNDRMRKAAAIALIVIGVAIAVAMPKIQLRPEYGPSARDTAIAIAITALAGGIAALWRRDIAVIALSIPILAIPLATNGLMQSLATRRSEKALAIAIRSHLTPDTEVAGVEAFTGSMAFYLQRPFVVVTPDGEEFTSNYIIRHYAVFADRSNLHTPQSVERLFDRSRPRVLVARDKDAKNRALIESHGGTLIAQSGHFVAYTIGR